MKDIDNLKIKSTVMDNFLHEYKSFVANSLVTIGDIKDLIISYYNEYLAS